MKSIIKAFLSKQIRNEQRTKNITLYLAILPDLASVTGEGLQQQLSSLQPVEGFDSCNENNCQEKIMFSIYTGESIDIKILKQDSISFTSKGLQGELQNFNTFSRTSTNQQIQYFLVDATTN
jgi:hypothetical protein